MPTVAQLITELVNPVLALIGVLLRGVGALAVGMVAGTVLRHGIDFKLQSRFFVPFIFLGAVLLVAVAGWGTWGSPGALAAVGIGVFVGYQFMRSRPEAEKSQEDDD